jgi:hypothetical protein
MDQLQPTPVYNARNLEMHPCLRARWVCLPLLCFLAIANASDWHPLESQLAQKIAAVSGPGVISLNISNQSSIRAPETEEIRRALVSALAASGVRVWEPEQAAATVQLTLSENLQSYVWLAEIKQGTGEPAIVIVSTPRPPFAAAANNSSPLTLRVTHLISTSEPILDFATVEGNPRTLIALQPVQVKTYQLKDNHWVEGQSLAINSPPALPRDLRGRVLARKDHLFDAYLPGLFCRSTAAPPLALSCTRSDDPWPLQTEDRGLFGFFAPTRNFFTGALVPGVGQQKSAPPFYSAAAVPRDKYTLWVLAGVDGQLHMLDGIRQQTLGSVRWGSDIAGIHTPCGQGWQVLATSPEPARDDFIQAFEFPDREPIAASQRLSLNGSITALWTATDGQSAAAVYRDSETGNYEAVLINPTCVQ